LGKDIGIKPIAVLAKWAYFRAMERITVVTICFNNLSDLQSTCASVDAQILLPFEHLIVNGSTELQIADWLDNQPQPSYRRWINERDKGISDAFNKGINHANGDIIHLLNSGDIYYSNQVLSSVKAFFKTNPTTSWISGKIEMKRGGIWVQVGVPFDAAQLYKGMRSVSHPTYFLKAAVYERVGLFSLDHKIAMDYDLLCRLIQEPYAFLPETLIRFDDKGVSTTAYLKSLKENIKVYESHFGYSIACRLWQFRLKLLYYLMDASFGKFLYRLKTSLFK
jgi:glycosyltransferase involved in cell wall biosynthesis